MKFKKTFLLTLSIGFAATAVPEVRNVKAFQQYPWGKVYISYELVGDVSNGDMVILHSVTAKDKATGQTYGSVLPSASYLSGDLGAAEGLHRIVWDIAMQGLTIDSTNVVFTVEYRTYKRYCVIDLSGGANATSYPVTYMNTPPSGGFNADTYKTTKLVLKCIEPGSVKMWGSYNVTLTKPFYCGIFEVTQKQYSLVTGSNPSSFSDDKLPVDKVSYNAIRGTSNGSQWPSSSAVDSTSFMGKLRARTDVDFDLPTEAQWEYACRAETTTSYSYGNTANGNYMWYNDNSSSKTHEVGTKLPNPWGLYDMHGNVEEWCLDWYSSSSMPSGPTDPKGSSSGSSRVRRGGCWSYYEQYCTSSFRGYSPSSYDFNSLGFRLVRTMSNQ